MSSSGPRCSGFGGSFLGERGDLFPVFDIVGVGGNGPLGELEVLLLRSKL